jgi:hypothetical protein
VPRTRIIGFSALAVCVLGYGGFALSIVLRKMDVLETGHVLMFGVPSALIGEIGLWVAAGALGWSIFKGRKALMDRLFRRKPSQV